MSKFRQYDNYEVYSDGRIWSYKKNRFLKPWKNEGGYQIVCLYDNEGKGKKYKVHRVVWETFSGRPIPNNLQVNHIDENKENNSKSNLELMTPKENVNWGSGIERSHKSQSKKVGAFNNNGELVMTFPSTQEAGRQGFTQSSVSACCRGERKTHKGYTWKYL